MEYQKIVEALEIIFSQDNMEDLDDFAAFCIQYLFLDRSVRCSYQNNVMKLYIDSAQHQLTTKLGDEQIKINSSHPMSAFIELVKPLTIYNSRVMFPYQFSLMMTIGQYLKYQCYAIKELISLFVIHHAIGRDIGQKDFKLFTKVEGFSERASDQFRESIDSRLERYITKRQSVFYYMPEIMRQPAEEIDQQAIKSIVSFPVVSNTLSDTQKKAIWYAFLPRLFNKYMNDERGLTWQSVGFKLRAQDDNVVVDLYSSNAKVIDTYSRLSKYPNSYKHIKDYIPDANVDRTIESAQEPLGVFNVSEIRESLRPLCEDLSTIVNRKLIFSDQYIIATALKYMCNRSFFMSFPLGLSPSMADYSWWASMYPLRSKIRNMFKDNRLFFQHTSQHLWDGLSNQFTLQKESWLYWVTVLFNQEACAKSYGLIETASNLENEAFELILSQLAYATSVTCTFEHIDERINKAQWLECQTHALEALCQLKCEAVSEVKLIVYNLFYLMNEHITSLRDIPNFNNAVIGFIKLTLKLQPSVITDVLFSAYSAKSMQPQEHIDLMHNYFANDQSQITKFGFISRNMTEGVVNSFRSIRDEVVVIPGYSFS